MKYVLFSFDRRIKSRPILANGYIAALRVGVALGSNVWPRFFTCFRQWVYLSR